jgi:hypothetical protein
MKAWETLDKYHCHICHKPISDTESVRLGIGGSDCRPRIEKAEGKGQDMWKDITPQELEKLYDKYNIYHNRGIRQTLPSIKRKGMGNMLGQLRYRRERLCRDECYGGTVYEKTSIDGKVLRVRVFDDSDRCLVYKDCLIPDRVWIEEARVIWKNW